MSQALITRHNNGGYSKGDTIEINKLQPIYENSFKCTDKDVIVYDTSGSIVANPVKDIVYNIYSISGATKINIYSSSGDSIASISLDNDYKYDWNIRDSVNFDSDGNFYMNSYDSGGSNSIRTEKVIKITPSGEVSDFINYEYNTADTRLFAINNDILYYFSRSNFIRYNKNGEKISTLAVDEMTYLKCVSFDDDNNCYVYALYKDGVQKYTKDLTKISAIDFQYDFDTIYIDDMFNADKYLYIFGHYGPVDDNNDQTYILFRTTMASSSDKKILREYNEKNTVLTLPDTVEVFKNESNTYIFNNIKEYHAGFGFYDIDYKAVFENLYTTWDYNYSMGKNRNVFALESSYSTNNSNPKYSICKYHPSIIGYKVSE